LIAQIRNRDANTAKADADRVNTNADTLLTLAEAAG